MNTRNFVNLHVLISHSPSCLNRDDMNMQKTAVFGGRTRVRISSQSLKYWIRKSDYYKAQLGKPSVRTRNLEGLIPQFVSELKDEFDPDLIAQVMEMFVRNTAAEDESDDAESDGETGAEGGTKKLAVAPWALEEIRVLCAIVRDVVLTADETAKAKEKAGKQKGKNKKAEAEVIEEALWKKRAKAVQEKVFLVRTAIGSALDIALAGRMATSGLMTSVDGALAVAHAITTHTVEPQDVDWFTAVDDLTQDAGETGAGHLNTQQFSAGVFYRYASLNLRQLQLNLGLIPTIDAPETPESRARALDVARHTLHLFATVVPNAKQQPYAAHNLADFVIVSLADQPVSLANAFERPIKDDKKLGGFLQPSIERLADYWTRVNRAYSLNEQARAFALEGGIQLGERPALESLADLEQWIARDGQD
ncbi:MAG: type I-E CRISPR-associated protein Cas7/Cse4/CasC [Lamprocystis purpurea]|jgi:CRISPR system Cascade subunit CasC|uniref:type I-E CRISPR-associated protein Cas7/Cse4/CasC n=1 Tax=Lamprocystis purpurea TaxID=61598 RepID=UPI00037C4211|nr:type I-E CRISPR-associated protein Cas7/Cse4/CasC [Lamprocystis purpurea]MBV5272586.1 type I-E CRISPR-associated protein Cas7/Cse4/CasC [Lamprocystis purpurea]